DAFDMHGALAACDDILVRWGGHRAAGGLTVEPRRIGELRARMAEIAAAQLSDDDMLPSLRADAVISGDDIGQVLVEELAQLAPDGTGNPKPLLVAAGAPRCAGQ